jgi:hypothetical protein
MWDINSVLYHSLYNFIRNIFYSNKYLESFAEDPQRNAFRFSCEVSFYHFQIFTNILLLRYILVTIFGIVLLENVIRVSRIVTCGYTDRRRTDGHGEACCSVN